MTETDQERIKIQWMQYIRGLTVARDHMFQSIIYPDDVTGYVTKEDLDKQIDDAITEATWSYPLNDERTAMALTVLTQERLIKGTRKRWFDLLAQLKAHIAETEEGLKK